jgi:hypothetical protein
MARFIALVALLLAGCGGGDYEPEEDHTKPPPVNCAERPEACR